MANLDKKASSVHIVIENEVRAFKKTLDTDKLAECLKTIGSYAFITHDKDTEQEGSLKRLHTHLVLSTKTPKKLQWYLDYLTLHLNLPSNVISIAPATDVLSNVRYLVHADDIDKHQYSWLDVKTNCTSLLEEAKTYIVYMGTKELIKIIYQCETMQQLTEMIGIDLYKKYYVVIKALWDEKYSKEVSMYTAVKNAKDKALKMILDNMRKFGLEKHCEEFMDLVENEFIMIMREANNIW